MPKKSNGTKELLQRRISEWERGRIFFIDDFADFTSQWGVRFGLSALAEEGFIHRLARGVYYYPKTDGEYSLKTDFPALERVAMVIAERDRARIVPFGDQAAYRLGLSSLRVSDFKYLSDGAPRTINLTNGHKIQFFHTSEVKIFDYCNETMQMVASAIRTLGKDMMDDEKCRKIMGHLKKVPEKEFLHDIKIPPAWVQEVIKELK